MKKVFSIFHKKNFLEKQKFFSEKDAKYGYFAKISTILNPEEFLRSET